MKIRIKHKESSVPPQAGQDIAGLISGMQQQLALIEKKIDTLINRAPSFQRHDRPRHYGEGRQDSGFRDRALHKAICAECNKECAVPFRPTGDRPVYCKDCFAKRKSETPFKERFDNRPERQDFGHERRPRNHHGGEHRRPFEKKKPLFRRKKR